MERQLKTCSLQVVVILVALLSFAPVSQAGNLDQELLKQMPGVMKYLQEKAYRNVGVLPFRLRLEPQQPTFQGALITNGMTEHMENALVLARNPEKPIQVISQARKTAQSKLVRAGYRTPADRKRLFDLSYELAVKDGLKFVAADVFLTGEIAANEDMTKTTVKIDSFDRMHPDKYTHVLSFEVPTDRDLLADMGEGFSADRRGSNFARGIPSPAGSERSKPVVAKKTASLVQLSICYDNQEQDLVQDSANQNNWTARAPQPGQKVVFDLQNTSDEKVGVVLLVNGYNTLYRECGLESRQWSRWILAPKQSGQGKENQKEYRIKGFYQKERKTFTPLEGIYSNDVRDSGSDFADAQGIIHMYQFTSQHGDARDVQSLGPASAEPMGRQPRTWAELNRQITDRMAFQGGRGVAAGSVNVNGTALSGDAIERPAHVGTVVLRLRNDPQRTAPAPASR